MHASASGVKNSRSIPAARSPARPLRWSISLFCCALAGIAHASGPATALLEQNSATCALALPDFSYAGYGYGLQAPALDKPTLLDARTFGAIADDDLDDSRALLAAISAANKVAGPVVVQLPAGRLIVSEVLRITRSDFVLRGHGKGTGGTQLMFPRPLRLVDRSHDLDELRQYLVANNKRQVEPLHNIDALFSEYSWTGGFIWIQKPGTRPAPYLDKYDVPSTGAKLTDAGIGIAGTRTLTVASTARLKVGDVVQLRWFSRAGKSGPLVRELYGNTDLAIGENHWQFPDRALVVQPTRIEAINGITLTIADPLMHPVNAQLPADIATWEHLSEVGIEDMALEFPEGASFGHHMEQGYNGVYVSSVFNGWVKGLAISNADSGVLTYDSANLTISDIRTTGDRIAHYSVHIGNVHDVLVSDLTVLNPVVHPLSVNTQATRSVFLRAEVFQRAGIDQHAGSNHQNLFDDVTLHVLARRDEQGPWYPVWDGSGASYWQPGHGRYNTTWNLRVMVDAGALPEETVRLTGLEEGPDARIIGISGNRRFTLDYRPVPYSALINAAPSDVPSLYEYQLAARRNQTDAAAHACMPVTP